MKIRHILYAAVAVVALMLTACDKQDYDIYTTIAGSVVEKGSSEPVAGAQITLSPSGKSTVTGSNGAFEFADVDAKQYTLTAQKQGYATNRATVTGVAGEAVQITITLESNAE